MQCGNVADGEWNASNLPDLVLSLSAAFTIHPPGARLSAAGMKPVHSAVYILSLTAPVFLVAVSLFSFGESRSRRR